MDCDGPRQHATSHVATVKGWKSIECGAVLPGSRTLKRMFKIVTCTTFATFFVNLQHNLQFVQVQFTVLYYNVPSQIEMTPVKESPDMYLCTSGTKLIT